MAVTRTGGTSSNLSSGTSSPVDVAFTLPGGTDYLLVCFSLGLAGGAISSVTWKPDSGDASKNQSLSLLARKDGTGDVEMWGLKNPTATVTGSVVTHAHTGGAKRVMGIHALGGVLSAGTPASTTWNTTSGSVAPASESGALVFDVLYGQNSTGTYTGGSTERWDTNTTGGLNNLRGCGQQATGASPTVTMSWTTPSTNCTQLAISFNPSNPQLVTPPTASLVTTKFAPQVNLGIIPPTRSLTATAFAPTVTASDHKRATPPTAALTLTTFAPTVTATANAPYVPGTASLTLTAFAPTVSTPVLLTPTTASLTLTIFAPTVSTPQTVVPGTASLTLTAFEPTVLTPTTVVPGTASLTLTGFEPSVLTPVLVVPGTASPLVLTGFEPTVSIMNLVVPGTASLVLTGFEPTVLTPQTVTPGTAALVLAAEAPFVLVQGPGVFGSFRPYAPVQGSIAEGGDGTGGTVAPAERSSGSIAPVERIGSTLEPEPTGIIRGEIEG
jgi:hypothetical protein